MGNEMHEIAAFYARGLERDRLSAGQGALERSRPFMPGAWNAIGSLPGRARSSCYGASSCSSDTSRQLQRCWRTSEAGQADMRSGSRGRDTRFIWWTL
jgi:hypothetical protein